MRPALVKVWLDILTKSSITTEVEESRDVHSVAAVMKDIMLAYPQIIQLVYFCSLNNSEGQ